MKSMRLWPPRVVVLCERSGDHCNRLFQSIHYHAYCLEHELAFWNPTLLGMLGSSRLISTRWGDHSNTALRLVAMALRKLGLYQAWQSAPCPKANIQLVGGWSYRCHGLTERYRPVFQSFYRIRHKLNQFEASVLAELQAARTVGRVIVGVHIRRGDYCDWLGGKYCFDDATYRSLITQIRRHYAQRGQQAWVIVCSNDPIEPQCGQDQTSRGRWFADQLILQRSDLLIGPPSTFTLWASYIAEIPYIHLSSADQVFACEVAATCSG